jgi:PAS domain S-box-containing protein
MTPRCAAALTSVKSMADAERPSRTDLLRQPLAVAVGAVSAVVLVLFNVYAFILGDRAPWLLGGILVADMLVVATGIGVAIREVLRAKEITVQAEEVVARTRADLEQSEAQLARIVDSAMDAIIAVDEKQEIVLFNRAAEQVFGCTKEQAIGGPLDRFIPPRFREAHRDHIERFGRTGVTSRRMGDVTALRGLSYDASREFPIEASISQSVTSGKRFYTVILRDITLRQQALATMQQQQQELRTLSARVLEAREEEKTLIARELHDELGQLLTAIKMDLASLRERLPAADPESAARLDKMGEMLDQTVAATRRISADLRPMMLDDLGLADAAAWLVDEFGKRAGLELRMDSSLDHDLSELDRALANTVYRALQESLTNIVRHAQAKRAWVVLAASNGELHLEVEDDGRGIAAEDLAKARSLGLKGMRERVSYHGGSIEIARAPRGGTRVRLRVPIRSANGDQP